jgi:soluble lytic murein transglycosylase-like protein
MGKRLHIVLMVGSAIATFLSLTPLRVQAADDSSGNAQALTATTDENGRRIWVNEPSPAAKSSRQNQAAPSGKQLMYWSSKEQRWKPVPHASMQAARSAAAEVNQILTGQPHSCEFCTSSPVSNYVRGRTYSPEQVDAAIEQAATRHNLDPNLVRAVVKVESDFNPNAVSRKGAMGLMQLMPSTARQLKVTNPFDPEQNVDAGVRHLKSLLRSYGGNVKLTLAAYNAGEKAVARNAGVPRIRETREYVKRITDLYYNSSQPGGQILTPSHEPVRVQRDERGILYISNTD